VRHERVLADIVGWATTYSNIRAVVLTGSAARGWSEVDDLSDLDVELYLDDPSKLLENDSWFHQFGEVLVVETLRNPDWYPTRLIYYVDGKVDFMLAPVTALVDAAHAFPFRVLVDKDGCTASLRIRPPRATPPRREDLLRCNHWFWAATLMGARCIVREEPWLAKLRDWDAKQELLQMIEWDHKARYGWGYDTWHLGKNLNRWADPDVREALESCWSDFDLKGMARSLDGSIELFDMLSKRTAGHMRTEPFDSVRVRDEVARILGMGGPRP
jgi:aminoglycoside 6-adenylyltransferase